MNPEYKLLLSFVDADFDEMPSFEHGPEFVRDLRPRAAHCHCQGAHEALGKKRGLNKTPSPVTARPDGSCPYCGYHTLLLPLKEILK